MNTQHNTITPTRGVPSLAECECSSSGCFLSVPFVAIEPGQFLIKASGASAGPKVRTAGNFLQTAPRGTRICADYRSRRSLRRKVKKVVHKLAWKFARELRVGDALETALWHAREIP